MKIQILIVALLMLASFSQAFRAQNMFEQGNGNGNGNANGQSRRELMVQNEALEEFVLQTTNRGDCSSNRLFFVFCKKEGCEANLSICVDNPDCGCS